MAEVMRLARILITLLVVAVCSGGALAQPPVPEGGLAAEMAGEWERAIEIYKDVLQREPNRADLWARISDIEAHLGNELRAAEALGKAAELSPDDADLQYQSSNAWAAADQPEPALEAVERALELDPDNVEYLRAHAELANWTGRSRLAAKSYERIMELAPEDDISLLHYARSSSWGGELDEAVAAYEEYLSRHPEEKDAHIELAKVESWRGNYNASLRILESYRKQWGETREYKETKARVLAWAERPTLAFEYIAPLLEETPDDYEVNYSRTIALHHDNRPREAIESLDKLSELRPDSKETYDIRRFVLTPLRSNVTFLTDFYTDSDDLDRYHSAAEGAYYLNPETRLEAGIETDYLRAERGSGLEHRDGSEHAWHHRGWLGAYHRFTPDLALDGYLGVADAEDKTRPSYGIGADYEPRDNLFLRLERDYGFYVVSPRNVSRGVRRGANTLFAQWEPDLLYTVVGQLGFDDFSDSNKRWEAVLAPRRSVMRAEDFNLDLGVRGQWYGFEDENPDNGYYDPEFYQSYMATAFGYWKISDDDGVSVALESGAIKDNDLEHFRFAWGANVEGIFGIYRDVMLRLGGGVSRNSRQEGGAFRAYMLYAALTFRF
jgi:tetratricopeptide (TPR) repeat protein